MNAATAPEIHCHCTTCDPVAFHELDEADVRVGPGVRFRVLLNGVEQPHGFAAKAGEAGWVAVYSSADHWGYGGTYRHKCKRCRGAGAVCSDILRGVVAVEVL